MRHIYTISLLAILGATLLLLTSFEMKKTPQKLKFKDLNLEFALIDDGVYMSTTEISNGQYRQFLQTLKEDGRTDDYHNCLQDTLVWYESLTYGEPFMVYYHSHPAYNYYPVVGVDLEDAQAFSQWLTDELKGEKKLTGTRFEVGLPTEDEWYQALGSKDALPDPEKDKKGQFNYNLKYQPSEMEKVFSDDATITAPVESYHPNAKGIYNLIGNVAELTAEGYIKGGSWNDLYKDVKPTSRQTLEMPGAQVGFRVVLRVR